MPDTTYVIGDVHGQAALLDDALGWIAADGGAAARHVFVGDLVDRGPDSRTVIERLMAEQAAGRDWHVVYGNHDRLFVQFVRDGSLNDGVLRPDFTWLNPRLGGQETLASYGVTETADPNRALAEARDKVPPAHLDWLAGLPRSLEDTRHFFAHAGIRPEVPLAEQTEDDLLWVRKPFHDHPGPHPKIIVHGHTPVDLPTHYGHRINVDGGAGYGHPIYPVILESGESFLLTESGRAAM